MKDNCFTEFCCFLSNLNMNKPSAQFSSVQSLRVSNSLRPHESQHARPPCPSPTPGVHSNSCPLSQWCHPAISSSVIPFSSCPQSLPASESFPLSQLFAWDSQSIGVSALASVLPMNTQDWSPLEWTGWISLPVQGTLKSLLQHHSSKASVLQRSAVFIVQLSHPYTTTGKTTALTNVQLFYHHLLKRLSFPPLNDLVLLCQRSVDCTCVSLLLGCLFCCCCC